MMSGFLCFVLCFVRTVPFARHDLRLSSTDLAHVHACLQLFFPETSVHLPGYSSSSFASRG